MWQRTFVRSFRLRVLLVIVLVALVPLGLVGVWITQRASRAGEELLRTRIDEALNFTGASISQRWGQHRSRLLDLADDRAIRDAVDSGGTDPSSRIVDVFRGAAGHFTSITLRRADGRAVPIPDAWTTPDSFVGPGVPMVAPVYESPLGPVIGEIGAIVSVATLVAPERTRPGSIGTIVGIYDADGRTPFVPLPFDPVGANDRIAWGGDQWLVVSRVLPDAPIRLVGAAPLSPFQAPAREAARGGLWILLAVSGVGVLVTVVLTTQMTKSLERLASAADAVSSGELERRVEVTGADEVARVGRAFNQMTTSLRSTLQELADQRALARVGEFAATLAHEVRNPLTAIRVDLQVAQESTPADARAARPIGRALEEIDRLDRTVSSALLATRASRGEHQLVDVLTPLRAACETAMKTSGRPLDIRVESSSSGPEPIVVAGDAGALEQVFLNVLLNAVEAVRDRGDVRITVDAEGDRAVVRIVDTGVGLSSEAARAAFEPFVTTRPGGTGLGLTIASRLTSAMGGSITLTGAPNQGAEVTVTLPRVIDRGPVTPSGTV